MYLPNRNSLRGISTLHSSDCLKRCSKHKQLKWTPMALKVIAHTLKIKYISIVGPKKQRAVSRQCFSPYPCLYHLFVAEEQSEFENEQKRTSGISFNLRIKNQAV